MKKIVSLFLTLSLILSFAVVSADAENTEGKYQEDIAVMSALGFMKSMNTSDENTAVTRAEFTVAVLKLMGIKAADNGIYFRDADKNHVYYNELSAAAASGIIRGNDGYFYPDKQISCIEAEIMLLNALGYSVYSDSEREYPESYIKLAAESGISDKVAAAADTPVTSGMAAKLLRNTGEAEMISMSEVSGENLKLSRGDTLFWAKHKIASGKGVLSANEYTHIDGLGTTGKNGVRIGNFEGYLYFNSAVTEYIGYNVEYYYKEEDGDNNIYYIAPIDSKNEITIISDEDFESYDEETKTLTYIEGARSKKTVIKNGTTVIYNGIATTNWFYNDGETERSIFDIDNGEIKLVDNNRDGTSDVISISAYENCFVSGVDTEEKIIYSGFGDTSLDFGDAEENKYSWVLTDENGKIAELDTIANKSVITYIKSEDGSFLRGVVSTQKLEGTVSTVYTQDGKRYISFGDEEYLMSKDVEKYQDIPSINANVILYFDYTGKVAAIDIKSTIDGYAFVIKKRYDSDLENYRFRLMLQDGTIGNYYPAEKIKVDGETYKGDGRNVYFETEIEDYQIIVVEMNEAGELKSIDTTKKGNGSGKDTLRSFLGDNTLGYAQVSGIYWNPDVKMFGTLGINLSEKKYNKCVMLANSSTIVFNTPVKGAANQYDEKYYSVSSLPTSIQEFNANGYTSDNNGLVAELVHYNPKGGASDVSASSATLIVKNLTTGLNEDDDEVTVIEGYSGKKEVTVMVSPEYDFSTFTDSQISDKDLVDANNLQVGDIIKYSYDSYGYLTGAAKIYSYGEHTMGVLMLKNWMSNASATSAVHGWVLTREDKTMALCYDKEDLTVENTKPIKADNIFGIPNGANVFVVENGRKRDVKLVDTKNLGAITDFKHNSKKNFAIVLMGQGVPNTVVIYKDLL